MVSWASEWAARFSNSSPFVTPSRHYRLTATSTSVLSVSDAASHAPPLSSAASPPRALAPTITTNQQQQAPPPASNHDSFSSSISNAAYGNPNAPRPSRRVREGPGGGSTVGDLLFGGPDENDEQVSFRTGKRLERNSKGAVGGEETWGPL